VTVALSDVRCAYQVGEAITSEQLAVGTRDALVRTAFGQVIPGVIAGASARVDGVPAGTHALELRSASGELLAEELVSVRRSPGEDPVVAFATSFDAGSVSATLRWLQRLRCTVVQLYDWMETYSSPLGPPGVYHDRLHRAIDRRALQSLIDGIRRLGAVPQAYAPVCAADPGTHPEWRLLRNDGAPESLGDLLEIMDPGSLEWQRHWLEQYGAAADTLGFGGFHLDTYGYPRAAADARGTPVSIEQGYASFVRAVRDGRPADLLSFNQVNGVPGGFAPPGPPAFRYAEVWAPNDRWRHLEGLRARSAADGAACGDTLAIYPPVWDGDRDAGLRTVVLSEAVATALGIGALIWGDAAGALRHPYYVDHERLTVGEAEIALAWHRFALRCRDLFRAGTDTSWAELGDENAAVTVAADVPVRPEPDGGSLFARVVHGARSITVSLLDLSGSARGSWSEPTARGHCATADVSALVARPDAWRASTAVLGRAGGRFEPVGLRAAAHREGRALTCRVPLVDGWSVVRFELEEG
jgi:dextranase